MSETKTISSKYIFQRLLANHTTDDSSWFNNGVDWVGQAMRFIGKHAGFPIKICCDVYVEDHHTCYPLGMEGLIAITYKGVLLPLGSDISGIGYERKLDRGKFRNDQQILDENFLLDINGLISQKQELINMYAITPTQEIAEKIEDVAGQINTLESYLNVMNQYQYGRKGEIGEFYNIKKDIIETSFDRGFIDIVFTTFPIDDEGFPLVIDNEFYIQAIEWYIILMLIQKGYKHPIFDWQKAYDMFWGDKRIHGDSGFRGRAANNVRIPSLQDTERFTRMWEQFRIRRTLPMQLFNRTEQLYGLVY